MSRRIVAGLVVLGLMRIAASEPFTLPLGEVQTVDQDATHAMAGDALRVRTTAKTEYPGITLKPLDKPWNWSPYGELRVSVKNTSSAGFEFSARVDSLVVIDEKDEPHSMQQRMTVKAGDTATLTVQLERAPANAVPLFGLRGVPPYAKQSGKKYGDPARVTAVKLFLTRPSESHGFDVLKVEVGGTYVGPKIPGKPFPLIDQFGQHLHADWPGKTHSLEEFNASVAAEAKDLAFHAGPPEWDRFGGWAQGPKLNATGHFRTEKMDGKWWLVDPDGRLFFSHGINCVRVGGETPIEERESWFAWLPRDDQPEYNPFWSKRAGARMGYYKDKPGWAFDFAGANLFRRFGADWKDAAISEAHTRLRSWGVNTLGNWSASDYCLARKTPYTFAIHFGRKEIEGSSGYWGRFPDPFDATFAPALAAALKQNAAKTAGDPWCIGYFVDNELGWGDTIALSSAALASPPTQPAKIALLAALKEKYDTIEKLNAAWGAQYATWGALAATRDASRNKQAREDLLSLNRLICTEYFRKVHAEVKAFAPNQLYLGCRFAWTNETVQQVAAEYCDVVSYNLYRRSIVGFKPAFTRDVPIMNTEWHMGALDRGPFHPGLVATRNQAERAQCYAAFVREHLANRQFVGCHWFQYRDQPATGRTLDGENYQIGFVDVCDRPYDETVAAARAVGYQLYALRTAK